MLRVSDIAAKQLLRRNAYGFAGLPFGKKRQKIKNDLPKYDIVIAGGNLGAILSNHIDGVVGDKASIYVAYENTNHAYHVNRSFYEQGTFTKFQSQGNPKNNMNKFAIPSEGQGITQYNPQNNEVVLRNGRKIQYDQLVIATGMDTDVDSIKGFEDAWANVNSSFFCNQDHTTWRTTCTKPARYHYNFNGGEAIFYIPPAPFHGTIENYNFFLSKAIWDRLASNGKLSWGNSRFTVINANNSFCPHFEKGDSFIKSELERNQINVQYGLKLVEVKDDSAVFQNLSTGELQERPYQNMYSLIPAKTQANLSEAGLADKDGFLDVDPFTLQHKKYSNIFGLGDVTNVPTTKTFFSGFEQLHVVRNNLVRSMNAHSLNASYDGSSSALMHTGVAALSSISHKYDGVSNEGLESGFSASLRYKRFGMFEKKRVVNISKFKNWGPPYYKLKKTFSETGSTSVSNAESLHPDKKSA